MTVTYFPWLDICIYDVLQHCLEYPSSFLPHPSNVHTIRAHGTIITTLIRISVAFLFSASDHYLHVIFFGSTIDVRYNRHHTISSLYFWNVRRLFSYLNLFWVGQNDRGV